MAVVTFNPPAFIAQYAEFSGLVTGDLTTAFGLATLYLNNTDVSVVQDVNTRTTLLWLLTAHILKIYYGTNNGEGQVTAPTDLVGRVEIAKEGTVHVRADMGPPSAAAAWYNQTRYGAAYWAATVRYRSMHYIPSSLGGGMNNPGALPAIWPWGRW